MPATPIRLGPFVGGINTKSDPAAIADTELVDCVNLDVDIDGSLVARPPFVEVKNNPAWASSLKILGSMKFGDITYLVGSTLTELWAYNVSSDIWQQIVPANQAFRCSAVCQYNNYMWAIASIGESGVGGYWNNQKEFTPVATMPQGRSVVAHKERLFVAGNDSTLYWSRPTDPGGDWNSSSAGFQKISPGDGEDLVAVMVYNDNLLLFKTNSIYIFSYDSDPALFTLRKINSTIGAANANSVVKYENSVYIYHNNLVYEFLNYQFSRVSTRVIFKYKSRYARRMYRNEVFLSLVGDRLILRYFGNVYAFGLRTRTWTRYETNQDFGPFVEVITNITNTPRTYIAGSCLSQSLKLYTVKDAFDTVHKEEMVCRILTKNFDSTMPHRYKRLFWWGADTSSVNKIEGKIRPVAFQKMPTWDDIKKRTWASLGTWTDLYGDQPIITTTIPLPSTQMRRFVKFIKSIRFRQASFEVAVATDGDSRTGPVRFYSLILMVDNKETVEKNIN